MFDEAHQLADIASNFNGERLGTRQFKDLVADMLNEWPILDLANQPLKSISHKADKLVDQLLNALPTREERISWDLVKRNKEFMEAWDTWLSLKDELVQCLESENATDIPGLKRCKERLLDLETILLSFTEENNNKIRWLERFKHTLVFHATPYDVAESFSQLLKHQSCAYIFTSATLTMASAFDSFCKPLGLDKVQTLLLSSPFDYQQQALLYLPRGIPDPKDAHYYDALVEKALPVIEACGGRCFFLFTSHKAVKLVAQMMSNTLKYPLLIQGDEAKPILLSRFRQLGNAVLLGTSTFWEGVDVKGEALSCVIIDKLPFANPVDPVIRGRMSYLKKKGFPV